MGRMHDEGLTDTGYEVDGGVGGDFVDDYDESTSVDDGTLPVERYLDRELSWLRFNQRVLELAEDDDVPLLERVNFLAIFASNLDEFFMVRVAGLKRRIVIGLAVPTNTGRAPGDVLADINALALELQHRHSRAFHELVKPALDDAGIHVESWADLSDTDRSRIDEIFSSQIFPVLMPLAVDPAHPFPYISGLSLNLSVRVRNPKTDRVEFARLKVPTVLPRFVQLPDDGSGRVRFLTLEDLISNHLDELFPGMQILEHHEFRVTRNEDVEVDEDETENLLQALERELLRRRFGPPIRLEITDDMDDVTLGLLVRELGITEQEVYRLPAPLNFSGLFEISKIDRPHLKYPKHVPVTPVQLQTSEPNTVPDVFASIARGDILVHHPYESFATSVQAFLEQAARDPNVLAMKQTLYRTSGDSPIIEALIDAAERGKAVLALVEIKARFDEQNNIEWARKLEKAGVHVVYGLVGLKTHCKLALVVRQEKGGALKHFAVGAFGVGGQRRGQAADQRTGQFNQGPYGGDADDARAHEPHFARPDGCRQLLGRRAGGQGRGDRRNAVRRQPGDGVRAGQDRHGDGPGQHQAEQLRQTDRQADQVTGAQQGELHAKAHARRPAAQRGRQLEELGRFARKDPTRDQQGVA